MEISTRQLHKNSQKDTGIRSSGSAGTAANVITENKSRFQYYELMRFLNDSLQTRPTLNSLTDSSAKSEVDFSLDTGNEQHEESAQNSIDDHEPPVKNKKNNAALQAALIEALREPATQAIDPLDGFRAWEKTCENCHIENELN